MINQVTMSRQLKRQEALRWYRISRQAYHQACQRALQKEMENQIIVELVQTIRQRHPKMGGLKLHYVLKPHLRALGISRGRDAFFTLLRANHLLVEQKRSFHRTTRSGLWRHANLLADTLIEKINQAWVGDITYIRTENGFDYLVLLTDVRSRFIVGYDLSSSLSHEGCLRALNEAIDFNQTRSLEGLIHHSDHGVQYTSWPYLDRLKAVGIRPSMGEVGNCYENPLAERMNGILKCEYGLDDLFVDTPCAQTGVDQAIWLYNFERPHRSLDLQKPADLYLS